MESLFLLIPLSIIVVTICAIILLWAIRSGQYDDLKGAANRVLVDEDIPLKQNQNDMMTVPDDDHKD